MPVCGVVTACLANPIHYSGVIIISLPPILIQDVCDWEGGILLYSNGKCEDINIWRVLLGCKPTNHRRDFHFLNLPSQCAACMPIDKKEGHKQHAAFMYMAGGVGQRNRRGIAYPASSGHLHFCRWHGWAYSFIPNSFLCVFKLACSFLHSINCLVLKHTVFLCSWHYSLLCWYYFFKCSYIGMTFLGMLSCVAYGVICAGGIFSDFCLFVV